MIQRSYKYRFYPTREQINQLAVELGHARFVWNWALDMRSKAYKRRKASLNNVSISRILTQIKSSPRYQWLCDATATCHTQKLRDLDAAFKNFFQGRARYPRFKKKLGHQSIRYQLDQRNVHRDYVAGERLRIPKLGAIKIKWSRLPQGIPKMATISVDPIGRYFVSLSVKEAVKTLPVVQSEIGIDMGIKDIVVTSKGWKSGAPKHYRRLQRKLAMAQRSLSRKTKGSKRREKQRLKVARIHAKIRDSRNDFLHKLSQKLVNENQVIGIETLNIKGMVRNRRLSKSITDSSLFELKRQLEYKAHWYGRQIESIDQWEPTSKTCSACGFKLDELNLSVREWTCPKCRTTHDRDINAAQNILHTVRSRSAQQSDRTDKFWTGIKARGGWSNPETAEVNPRPLMASRETRIHRLVR